MEGVNNKTVKKRVVCRSGDVFSAKIGNNNKCYFQLITKDLYQLYSSVIRVFHKIYSVDSNPSIEEIVKDEIMFYSYTFIQWGIKLGYWDKIGHDKNFKFNVIPELYFATCQDFIRDKDLNHIPINPLENFDLWKICEPSKKIGIIPSKIISKVEVGLIYSAPAIIYRMKTGYFNNTDPAYSVIKRKTRPDVHSFVRREEDGTIRYFHFLGVDLLQEIKIENDIKICRDYLPDESDLKFSDINWLYQEFITEADFQSQWES